jgi:hypothetical protein
MIFCSVFGVTALYRKSSGVPHTAFPMQQRKSLLQSEIHINNEVFFDFQLHC